MTCRPLLAALLSILASSALAQPAPSPVPLAEARRDHATRLVGDVVVGGEPAPEPPASMFSLVRFPSPAGQLVAYLSPDPALRRSSEHGGAKGEPRRYPALVWCHGGFGGLGPWLWEEPRYVSNYRARDLVVLCPAWRGENDNPGRFEMFYGEVEDARAAIEYVATLPYVDPKRIYIAGHSTGGTIALLTALTSPEKLRAAFSFGGAPDLFRVLAADEDFGGVAPPFDRTNPRELLLRSPTYFVDHLKIPTWYFEGGDSFYCQDALAMGQRAARSSSPLSVRIVSGGDHFNILEPVGELLAKELAADTKPKVVLHLGQDAVRDAFEAHPNAADHFSAQGLDLIDSDPGKARELFDRALDVNPGHLDALVNRGVLHEREGRLELALVDLNEALVVAPEDFYAFYNRGIVHHGLGRYEDAMGDYSRAIAIDPEDSMSYSSRAMVRVDTNDPAGAREDYDRALALDPQNVEAQNGLAALQGQQQVALVTDTAVGVAAPLAVLAILVAVFLLIARANRASKAESQGRVGYRDRRLRRRRSTRKASDPEFDSEPMDEFELVGSDPQQAADEDVPELNDSTEGEED